MHFAQNSTARTSFTDATKTEGTEMESTVRFLLTFLQTDDPATSGVKVFGAR